MFDCINVDIIYIYDINPIERYNDYDNKYEYENDSMREYFYPINYLRNIGDYTNIHTYIYIHK